MAHIARQAHKGDAKKTHIARQTHKGDAKMAHIARCDLYSVSVMPRPFML